MNTDWSNFCWVTSEVAHFEQFFFCSQFWTNFSAVNFEWIFQQSTLNKFPSSRLVCAINKTPVTGKMCAFDEVTPSETLASAAETLSKLLSCHMQFYFSSFPLVAHSLVLLNFFNFVTSKPSSHSNWLAVPLSGEKLFRLSMQTGDALTKF